MDIKNRHNHFNGLLILFVAMSCFQNTSRAQQTHINLKQGTLVGVYTCYIFKIPWDHIEIFFLYSQLKVFPDSARSAVYAFLGVPYAQAPVGELRFAVSMHTDTLIMCYLNCLSYKSVVATKTTHGLEQNLAGNDYETDLSTIVQYNLRWDFGRIISTAGRDEWRLPLFKYMGLRGRY